MQDWMITIMVPRAPRPGESGALLDLAVYSGENGALMGSVRSLSLAAAVCVSGEFKSGLPAPVNRPSAPES